MVEGNRKRANVAKPKMKTIYQTFPAKTLTEADAEQLKGLFILSNNVAALIKDYAEKEILVKHMRDKAKQIKNTKEPLLEQISKNLFIPNKDYMDIHKKIKEQASKVEKANILTKGQIEHRYESYITGLMQMRRFLDQIINSSGLSVPTITGHRGTKKTKDEETVLFEKEFDKMTDADKSQLKNLQCMINKKKKGK